MPWVSSLRSTEASAQKATSRWSSGQPRAASLTRISVASTSTKQSAGTTPYVPDNVRRLGQIERLDTTEFYTKVASYVNNLPMGYQQYETREGTQFDVKKNSAVYDFEQSIPVLDFETRTKYSIVKALNHEADVQASIGMLDQITFNDFVNP
ncbi:hypothetical protein FRB90_004193 [Tulasnella sp. 427]|nr:hypothetical protein FRB90_004193 [Tulasnella sp. 427]